MFPESVCVAETSFSGRCDELETQMYCNSISVTLECSIFIINCLKFGSVYHEFIMFSVFKTKIGYNSILFIL